MKLKKEKTKANQLKVHHLKVDVYLAHKVQLLNLS
jgi:hypothetical protein